MARISSQSNRARRTETIIAVHDTKDNLGNTTEQTPEAQRIPIISTVRTSMKGMRCSSNEYSMAEKEKGDCRKRVLF